MQEGCHSKMPRNRYNRREIRRGQQRNPLIIIFVYQPARYACMVPAKLLVSFVHTVEPVALSRRSEKIITWILRLLDLICYSLDDKDGHQIVASSL